MAKIDRKSIAHDGDAIRFLQLTSGCEIDALEATNFGPTVAVGIVLGAGARAEISAAVIQTVTIPEIDFTFVAICQSENLAMHKHRAILAR